MRPIAYNRIQNLANEYFGCLSLNKGFFNLSFINYGDKQLKMISLVQAKERVGFIMPITLVVQLSRKI